MSWRLDPDARTLDAFRSDDGRWTRLAALAGAAEIRVPPFDAIAVPLDRLSIEGR